MDRVLPHSDNAVCGENDGPNVVSFGLAQERCKRRADISHFTAERECVCRTVERGAQRCSKGMKAGKNATGESMGDLVLDEMPDHIGAVSCQVAHRHALRIVNEDGDNRGMAGDEDDVENGAADQCEENGQSNAAKNAQKNAA